MKIARKTFRPGARCARFALRYSTGGAPENHPLSLSAHGPRLRPPSGIELLFTSSTDAPAQPDSSFHPISVPLSRVSRSSAGRSSPDGLIPLPLSTPSRRPIPRRRYLSHCTLSTERTFFPPNAPPPSVLRPLSSIPRHSNRFNDRFADFVRGALFRSFGITGRSRGVCS